MTYVWKERDDLLFDIVRTIINLGRNGEGDRLAKLKPKVMKLHPEAIEQDWKDALAMVRDPCRIARMNNTLDPATKEVLLKTRKSATASFEVKQLGLLFNALGGPWKFESKKEGRTVVSVTLTAPNGSSVTEVKEPQYKRVQASYAMHRFLHLTGVKDAMMARVSELLGMPTYEDEQAEKVMYGVQYDLNNAGICPVCFRVQKLDENGKMVSHGYRRPGDGQNHGNCFGVGYVPLEVSPVGSRAYQAQVAYPSAVACENAYADFLANPPQSFERKTFRGEVEIVNVGDAWYDSMLESETNRLKRAAEEWRRISNAYDELVGAWVPDITPIERKATKAPPKMLPYIRKCW